VGVFALKNGRPGVVEYSEISKETSAAKNSSGELVYNWAHLCMNLFSIDFIRDIVNSKLVYHIAKKKIPYINEKGEEISQPLQVNGWKLEMFIFDVFEHSSRMKLFEVERSTEFSPLKNAKGGDSPVTCRLSVSRLHKAWLAPWGVSFHDIAHDIHDIPHEEKLLEISPLLSLNGEGLEAWAGKNISLPAHLQ
jgi:UDP-N-acetylglucosamine/UDP-N-acetylgalactosamine diphosphorylase